MNVHGVFQILSDPLLLDPGTRSETSNHRMIFGDKYAKKRERFGYETLKVWNPSPKNNSVL